MRRCCAKLVCGVVLRGVAMRSLCATLVPTVAFDSCCADVLCEVAVRSWLAKLFCLLRCNFVNMHKFGAAFARYLPITEMLNW